MSWGKNGFSYLVWVIYVFVAGVGLLGVTRAATGTLGVNFWLGVGACVLYLGLAGLLVFLLHRCSAKSPQAEKRGLGLAVEAAVTVLLLAAGLVLRLEAMDGAGENAAYFETACVTEGQGIPPIVHGAVHFYVQLLHVLFYLLGNKFAAAVGLQIALQLGAVFLLFLSVRKLAGRIAAMIMLAFCMCSSYMIQSALTLSPEMLYLLLWAAVLGIVTIGCRKRLHTVVLVIIGVIISAVIYLDVAGVLLFLLTAAIIFAEKDENPGIKKRFLALLFCGLTTIGGFFGWVLADSLLSGKKFGSILTVWWELYRPEAFAVPLDLDVPGLSVEYLILFGVLAVGIFSFWRDKTRDYRKAWVLGMLVLGVSACYGIFTAELPATVYLYLLLALLAGIAVEECLRMPVAVQCDAAEVTEMTEIEVTETEVTEIVEVQEETTDRKPVQLIENPLPLPKKHVKRVLDYSINDEDTQDEFDIDVDENDDFDI